jgi:uncharacterized protein involved in exopolysaccharide biosynthesis
MTEKNTVELASAVKMSTERQVSILALASILLRRRRVILVSCFFGGVIGGIIGLMTTRTYSSSAIFLSQASDAGGGAGLAAAATQLGIRVPAPGGGWSSALFAQIARSRAVLGPIVAADSFLVPEAGSGPSGTLDLLRIKGVDREQRIALGVLKLQKFVQAAENKQLGTVLVTVTTPWPSFSLSLTQRVLAQIGAFNVQVRKSQATAERQFAEQQVAVAERALRSSENKLLEFLQGNRDARTPNLTFERDRLQRVVNQQQALFTTLLQSVEEARLREVRDTPVISVIEEPRIALKSNGRGTLLKAFAGALLAGLLAMLSVLLLESVRGARAAGSPEAGEFFNLLEQTLPRLHQKRE